MILFPLFMLCAVFDWIVIFLDKRALVYIFKPATLILLIAWFATKIMLQPSQIPALFLIGLLLSLAGDVFLMLPRDQFLLGLIAFLFAHVAYIAGFNADGVLPTPGALALALLIGVITVSIFLILANGLKSSGRSRLLIPVALYVFVLSLMTWSASITLLRPECAGQSGLLATSGGLFFLASDGVLGWDRFVKVIPHGRLIVHITYHVAQALIVLGVLYRYDAFAAGILS